MIDILKKKLNDDEVAFGTFVKVNSPAIVEMLGLAGFDFIIIDSEHSSFSYLEAENLVRAADGVGMSSIIRIPSAKEEHIQHALDSGAGGIQVPGLSTVEEVKAFLPFTKYYPYGTRGLSFAQRSANYGLVDTSNYVKTSNEGTTVVVHIENKEMAEKVDELCQIPEVDVLFVGPADMSQSMGKPGAMNDPEVVALIEKVFSKAAQYNKKVGIFVGAEAGLEKYIKLGAKYIAWKSDIAMFANIAKDADKLFAKYKK